MRVYYACITFNRLPELARNIPVIQEYLQPDVTIVVDGGSTDGSVEFLTSVGVKVLTRRFTDFVGQRNFYLDVVAHLARPGDLVVVSDTDEFIQPDTLEILREVAERAEEADCNLIRIRCRSEWTDKFGKVVRATLDDYSKPLVALWEPGGTYLGAGGRSIHEELHFPSGRRFFDLPDENGKYVYVHRKQIGVVYLRAFRNFFMADLDPSGAIVPANQWHEFRQLFFDREMETWPDVEAYLIKGDIDQGIKDWLTANRLHAVGEVRNSFKGYFVFCHPEEMPAELLPEYQDEILEIHGAIV